ncbi:Fukutin [Aphelenchoides avenae]|nr:Fukutin [Aphelenchus avenae]
MTARTILLDSGRELVALVPDSIPRFLKSWARGRFYSCKRLITRAENVARTIPLSFADSIAEFRDLCEEHNVTCSLFGGSLLGWYRECSIIPHTWDFDFAMRRSEHSEELIQTFIDSKTFRLKWILGRLNDSLELTVIKEGQPIDLFYLYEDAARGMDYTAGMNEGARQQLRWYQPKMQGVCAGDLLDKLVYVPCNTVDVLRATYGDKWMKDHPSGQYDWLNSPKNVEFGVVYSSTEWPLVMRRYDH